MRCTKVDLPAPAMPIVMMAMGFFFDDEADGSIVAGGKDEELGSNTSFGVTRFP